MKKGRHRRYEEARKFQRDTAAQFTVENFDFDAPDPFSLSDRENDDTDFDDGGYDDDGYDDAKSEQDIDSAGDEDDYSDLAAKYADFDTGDSARNGSRDGDDA
ncbi:MAG: hypothetical protein P8N02_19540 [Actinomycetota bacterium]|nr:hypothetical protein [Actinomycetota bacterium]